MRYHRGGLRPDSRPLAVEGELPAGDGGRLSDRGSLGAWAPRAGSEKWGRHRLEEIRDNLLARITEAEREGWTGEAEGLKVSLAAANNKIAQADATAARRAEAVSLGIPAYRDVAATTLTAPGDPRDH